MFDFSGPPPLILPERPAIIRPGDTDFVTPEESAVAAMVRKRRKGDKNNIVLLHMDGADASTTFTDSAAGGSHTWTAANGAQIDTAQSKFGGASGRFAGNNDHITTADADDLDFGTDPFTIDFWFRFSNNTGFQTFYDHGYVSSGALAMQTDGGSPALLLVYVSGTEIMRTTTAFSDGGAFKHLAVVRQASNSWRLFVNGTQEDTSTNTTSLSSADPLYVGTDGNNSTTLGFDGWFDEYRIRLGAAWTSNFTPQTEPYV